VSVLATRRLALALAAAGFLLIGTSLAVAAERRSEPRLHTVTIEGNAFRPDDLTVDRGDSIVWVNHDFYPHTATDTGGLFDSGVIPANESWTLTVESAGELRYFCTFHPTMKATLRVR
jgi:plastocyanin